MDDAVNRVEAIFTEALRQAGPAQRAAFLAGACGDDARLRARVEALLKAHDDAGSFMARPDEPSAVATLDAVPFRRPSGPAPEDPPAERPGSAVGNYRLLEQIGEGGFGVVYMAEQERPVRRRVALKVIKTGMDTRAVIARFEAERQALAMMDHPNIARVLDAGATDAGRPYFVMELVKGIPITDYCDQANLDTRQRLGLFTDVCRAVQHAHQKGIIHRDLKPSNVMVTLHDGQPVVKVIDFGIAKATDQKLTEMTLFTGYGQMLGTPAYMSPEQAVMSGLDVDTRSDVYSLGVLLYELLTGSPPFDARALREAGFDEMRRIIREQAPQKPSTRMSTMAREARLTVATRRQVSPEALGRHLYGDLDWIVLKAIEKDRGRRYEWASAFAQDVERHLRSEPVVAGAPGAGYRVRKFVRRNRGPVAAAVAIALLLLVGTAVSTWQAVRATRARGEEFKQRIAAQGAQAVAVAQQKRAEAQQRRADGEKLRAERQLSRAERLVYAGKLMLAQTDFEAGNGGLARHYLDQCQPNLRGWEYRYLRTRIDAKRTLRGHADEVSGVAFSPDGNRIVTGSRDGTAKVWDAATLTEEFAVRGDKQYVLSVAFSPDGRRIVTGGGDWGEGKKPGEVKVWDAATGRLLLDLKGHDYCVWSVAFSPDGNRITSGAGDWAYGPGEAKVWDAQTGRQIRALDGHQRGVRGVAFSPDGKRIVTASEDETAKLWDAETGQGLLILLGHAGVVCGVAFSPDGRRVVTGNGGKTAVVWDATSGQRILVLAGHTGAVNRVTFSPDGKRVVTGSADQTTKLWDAASGREIFTLKGHGHQVIAVAFSPDGRRIVTGSIDRTAKLWDADRGQEVPTLNGHGDFVNCIAFSPDGQRVVTASGDGTAIVWNAASGEELLTLKGSGRGHWNAVGLWGVAFSPDGKRIVTGSQDKSAKVWDASTGRPLLTLKHAGVVSSVAYSPDGRRIVTGVGEWGNPANPGGAKVWDALTGRELLALKHANVVWGVAYSPDGTRIVTGSGDRRVRVWDAATGGGLHTLKGRAGAIHGVAFSPDGKRVAAGSDHQTAKVWDVATGQQVLVLTGHTGAVRGVAFSPDGRRIVTASDDRAAKVWDSGSGQEVLALNGHVDQVWSVAFSPDGERVATGIAGADATVKVSHAPPGPQTGAREPAGQPGGEPAAPPPSIAR